MNTQTIRIVAAVVDTHALTMYKDDGETIIINQGDPRLRRIVEAATPQLIQQGYADIELEPAGDNSYAHFEKEGSGIVKFFRVAKDKLKNLFTEKVPEPLPLASERVIPMQIGVVPIAEVAVVPAAATSTDTTLMVIDTTVDTDQTSDTPATDHIMAAGIYDVTEADEIAAIAEGWGADPAPVPPTPEVAKALSVIDEIMLHAVPVDSPEFHEDNVAKQGNVVEATGHTDKQVADTSAATDTIIAVVDGKVIPGMERIKTQFARAAKLGSTQGVENFLQRIAAVIDKRSHSIEDLLKFMERADMPIADDGSIIIYKVLKRKQVSTRTDGAYVDCHTQKVEQWTGAYVCMDPSLVDPNRRNECSNGLHVARRGYIREFSGDVCVLAKLAPEDVIAVPEYDTNKMRVCGYHILMELTETQYSLLRQNRPLTDDPDGKSLLAAAISGNHIRRTHEVRITQQNGGGVQVKNLTPPIFTKPPQAPVADFKETAPVAVVQEAVALENPEKEMLDKPTDIKEVVKKVEQLTRKEQAAKLYADYQAGVAGALEELKAFKKAAKVGWEKLGLPDLSQATAGITFVTPKPAPQVMDVELDGSEDKRGKVYKESDAAAPKYSKELIAETATNEGTYRERIQKLLAIGVTSAGVAQAIWEIKKQSKKGWAALGVTEAMADQIVKQLN